MPTYDLPPVKPVADERIARSKLQDRVKAAIIDIDKAAAFPSADVITMGNILHGYNEESKQQVIGKVYGALNDGGVFIAIENIIDNERRKNALGLMMSLNMLIENGDGFDYTLRRLRRVGEGRRIQKDRRPSARRSNQRGDCATVTLTSDEEDDMEHIISGLLQDFEQGR